MVYKAIYVYMGRPPCKIPLDTSPRIEMALNNLNLNLKMLIIQILYNQIF